MSNTAIRIEGLSKAYRIGLKEEIPDTLLALATGLVRAPVRNWRRLRSLNTYGNGAADEQPDLYWALKDVSFEVAEGEVVGIIGRNGAGKSTLLKVLSRITEPTRGRVTIHGRVSSLLEVGTGFHPELSGRENIYMNGTILGMTKREIDRKFDEIVAFSGVEQFLDTPVKRYSSGMKVRLAFAVAAHLEPEILIIDEVLAVGDQEFQNKCLGKMQDVATSGRTVLFVSHNMAAVEGLCSRGVVLDRGRLTKHGPVREALAHYVASGSGSDSLDVDLRKHPARVSKKPPVFTRLRLTDDVGETLSGVRLWEPVTFEVSISPQDEVVQCAIGIHIYNELGARVATCHTGYQYEKSLSLSEPCIARCRLESWPLMPGRYGVVVAMATGTSQIDRVEPALNFDVLASDVYGTGKMPPRRDGMIVPKVEWRVESSQPATIGHESIVTQA